MSKENFEPNSYAIAHKLLNKQNFDSMLVLNIELTSDLQKHLDEIRRIKILIDTEDIPPKRLLLITGVSSSGKSTYSKLLTSKHPNWVYFDQDKIWREEIFDFLKATCPVDFNVAYSLFGKELLFSIAYSTAKEGLYTPNEEIFINKYLNKVNDKQLYIDALTNLKTAYNKKWPALVETAMHTTLHKSTLPLRLGLTTIIDSVLYPETLHHYVSLKPHIILVYASPKQLKKNIISRNEIALKTKNCFEWRNPWRPYMQFSHLFCKKTSAIKPLIDNIYKEEFAKAVFSVLRYLPCDILEKVDICDYLLKGLGLNENDHIEITSSYKVDQIIKLTT